MRGFRARWDNERFYMIVSVFYGLGVSFLSEGYVQAYLLELGMGVREIGLYGTLGYVAALAAYALFAVYRPRSGGYLGSMFVAALMLAAFPLILTAAGGLAAPGVLVLAGGALYQFMLGFRGSCDYSVVPVIMPRASYGRLSSRCGMIGSGLAAAVSAMGAVVIAGQNAMTGYRAMFIAAAAALLISAAAIRGYRPSHRVEAKTRAARRGRRMSAKNAWILLPHLLRGIASGGFYYFVAISLDRVTLGASGSSLIVTVGVVGSMMGCLAFMQLEKRMKTGAVTLIGNVGAGLCALATAFNRSPVLFFALYFGYMMFNNVSAYAIPAGVVYSVPEEDMPFISSMRMLMMSVGSTVCVRLFSAALEVCPAWEIMAASAAVYLAAGLIFRAQYTDELKRA